MVPGDWVKTYDSGIWQVYRILPIKYEMRYSLTERRKKSKRVIVFTRRVVNDKWRRSFKTACCEQSLVTPLSPEDQTRIDRVLKDDAELRGAFDQYVAEPVPLIVNLTMGIPDRSKLEAFCVDKLVPTMPSGVTMEEVLRLLDASDLTQFLQMYPIRATLQMVCHDHEVRDDDFVLRDCRVLPF